MEVNSQHHAPVALPPGKYRLFHLTGDVVGPRAGRDGFGEEKIKFVPIEFRQNGNPGNWPVCLYDLDQEISLRNNDCRMVWTTKLKMKLILQSSAEELWKYAIYIHSNEIHNVAALIVYWCIGVSQPNTTHTSTHRYRSKLIFPELD